MRVAILLLSAVVGVSGAVGGDQSNDPEAAVLAQNERAFAQLCVEKGVRASFLAYFADDAIGFEPGPIKARLAMLARPAPATKPPYTLDWWPEVVKLSRSGDFGWSTGPSHRTPDPGATPPPAANDGHYFSIWKKQADGTWKVSLDIGIACPLGSIAPRGNVRLVRTGGTTEAGAVPGAANALQDAIARAVATGNAAAVLGRFTPDVRFYVDGQRLVTGAGPAREALNKLPVPVLYEASGADMAASGDLAVTYGRLAFDDGSGKRQGRWLVLVWQRNEPGAPWLVTGAAYDAVLPQGAK